MAQTGSPQQHFQIHGEHFNATVTGQFPEVDPATRTRTVVLQLDPPTAKHVAVGQMVRLELEETVEARGFWLPSTAMARGPHDLWSTLVVEETDAASDAPIELRLYGPNIDRLAEIGDEARTVLAGVPDVLHTDTDLTETLSKLHVQVDEEEARLAGLDHAATARQLDATLEGAVDGSLLEATEELPIRVRLADGGRGNLAQIASLDLLPVVQSRRERESARLPARMGTFSGQPSIPLSALVNVALAPERAVVARRNGRRVNVVRGYITAGAPREGPSRFSRPPGDGPAIARRLRHGIRRRVR